MPPSDFPGPFPPPATWNAWYEWDPADDPPPKRRNRSAAKPAPPRRPASSRTPNSPSKTALQGEWGERKAEKWLVENAGLSPIGRRVKVGRDELDLVMKAPATPTRPEEIVFVEVKTRSSRLFGGGLGAIDRRKRHALGRAASRWMMRNADCPMRIDVVEVYGDFETDRVDEILHQKAAVPLERRIDALALGCGRRTPASAAFRFRRSEP